MTCNDLRDLLPLIAYGEPTPVGAEAHLTACPACRAELTALADVRRALAATPVPAVRIDAGQLLAEAATRQVRRWRRLALAAGALAAGLLAFVATRLDVRVGDGQFVVSWAGQTPSPPSPLPQSREKGDNNEERLRLIDELTRALAADIDERDARRVGEIAHLRARLDALQRLSMERWQASQRDLDALYTAQFKSAPKGDSP